MRVTLATLGRFHAFDLAEQLRQQGCLSRLYTATPAFKIAAALRPLTRTFPWILPLAGTARWTGWEWGYRHSNWLAIDRFDRWAARRIEPCDVLVHLSGFGLHTARRARVQGAAVVCDRGSSHILTQDELLAEEHARWQLPYHPMDRRIVDKELQEYQEADLITVPSTFALRSFIEKGVPEKKIRLLPYGVDLALFRPVPKQDKRFRILFVGTYSLQKGIGDLLEAVKPLVKEGAAEVWLVGNATPEAQAILRRNASVFTDKGHQPRTRLPWFYSQGSVLVQPSIQEGMSLVMAQAMACGLPVIATRHTGAEDLFSDGKEGFIVPIRDPKGIRERIRRLMENSVKRQAMGEAALRLVRGFGGWSAYGKQAVEIYRRLMNKPRNADFHGHP